MKSFDILDDETPIFGRRFLEASAGTGKTFTIEHLVIRLLIEGGLRLDQILVVTFTRAATRELKMRIRAKLPKNMDFDEAQIFTIHGFCQKITAEFAFEASSDLEYQEWSHKEEKEKLCSFLQEKCAYPLELALLIKRYRNDFGELLKAILSTSKTEKEASFPELYEEFSRIVSMDLPDFDFSIAKGNYKKMTDLAFLKQAELLKQILERKKASIDEFASIASEKPYFLEGISRENLKVKGSPYPLLEEVKERLFPIIQKASDPEVYLHRLRKEWIEERKKTAQLSPDDILERMQQALKNPIFVQRVREKYKAVIVDEFQDTDPIQWNIFETLFMKADLKAFYLVGDPKQSIYAFRKADIYTFLKAKDHFEEVFSLDTNFRSEPGLLAELNRLFCSREWIDLPLLQSNLIVPFAKTTKEGDAGEVHFFSAEGHMGRERNWPTLEMEERYFFPYIAEKIEKPEAAAVLVKDRYQAERLKRFLQKWNIPCSVRRGTLLSESTAFWAFKDILKAALDPYDTGKVKKALMGPLIHRLYSEEDLSSFLELHEVLLQMGFASFYASILEKFKVVETEDLHAIAEKLMEEKHIGRLFSQMEALEEEEEENPRGYLRGVQIMTIHASKGLEFDTVFALGLASRNSGLGDRPEEQDAEKMRQLYVAMTRAKKELYVPIAKQLEEKELEAGAASPIELFLKRTAPELKSCEHLNDRTFIIKKIASEIKAPSKPLPFPKVKPLWLRSFSGMSHPFSSEISPPSDILPLGAETGVIIHKIFERAFSKVPLSKIVSEETEGTHLQGWEKTIEEMVDKTLRLPLDGFTLRDISPNQILQELEFIFPHEEMMIKGFIDLCFEYGGKYYFLDWKTNWLEDYSPIGLKAAMEKGDYFLQGKIYATALQRYIKNKLFGGAFYVFVRAPAAYHFYPEVFNGHP